jgi:hypothetical protein
LVAACRAKPLRLCLEIYSSSVKSVKSVVHFLSLPHAALALPPLSAEIPRFVPSP